MARNNSTLLYRMQQIEINVKELDNKLETLLTNDLPHIQISLKELSTRINVLTAVNIGAVILGVIVSKIL